MTKAYEPTLIAKAVAPNTGKDKDKDDDFADSEPLDSSNSNIEEEFE